MPVKLIRIDDRLIHGQVCTTWVKYFNIKRIDIIDDGVADDPIQQTILQLTAPSGVETCVYSVESYGDVCKNETKYNTMLIFTNPEDILRLSKRGMKVEYINVGGMKYIPGKRQITNSVSLDNDDIKAFREMIGRSIRVEIQIVPSDKKIDIGKYL
jgi:Phosphotransferase system, mannose/fructose/N-acetylgalactosamine-specific component IIB